MTRTEVTKAEFEEAEPQLRVDLVNAQYDLQSSDFSVLILIVGDDKKGVNELLDRLHEWLDARYVETEVFLRPTEDERERPRHWRYWRALPPKGRIGIHVGGWTLRAVGARLLDGEKKGDFERRLKEARAFERCLVDDGTLLLKFYLHVPKKELKRRLARAKKEPYVDAVDAEVYERYDEVLPLMERARGKTDTKEAPWHVIESVNERDRDLTVARTVLQAIQGRLAGNTPRPSAPRLEPAEPGALTSVDLSRALDREDYRERLGELQRELGELSMRAYERGVSTVLAFEGWDAAGKGGVIRRLTGAMPARLYRVLPVAAPSAEEATRHYLWRFWRHLPRAGRWTIFDRTWYGRVLVERVEDLARPDEWQRAYDEINAFERQLVDQGIAFAKFYLHIDREEQLRRFEAREATAYKKYKITSEDYRNRGKWEDYVDAIDEMVARTSTDVAPWHVVPANNKYWARVSVLKTVCKALRRAL